MAKKAGNYGKLHDSLCAFERSTVLFSVLDLASEAGYKTSSLRVYIRNRLKGRFLLPTEDGKYRSVNAISMDRADFIDYMNQKSSQVPRSSDLSGHLIKRSIASFYLALECYNRPTLSVKTEAFCILMVNAWELLLKALIVKQYGETTIITADGHTISISNAITKVFPKPDDPVRGNLEHVVYLRNQSAHYLLRECSYYFVRLFQTSVINYLACLKNAGHRYELEDVSSGLILASDDINTIDYQMILHHYGQLTVERIRKLENELRIAEEKYTSNQFAIPIEHRVIITKNPKEGQMLVSYSTDEGKGYLAEIPRDPDKTHNYRENTILPIIQERLPEVRQTQFRAYLHFHKVKEQKLSRYHFLHGVSKTHCYSEQLADFMVSKCKAEPKHLEMCVEKFKVRQKAASN